MENVLLLTRESILNFDDTTPTVVPLVVPEWRGATVHIRVMTGAEREKFENAASKKDGKIRATFASLVCCDLTGKRIFGDADIDALSRKSVQALHRIFVEGMKFNKLLNEDIADLEKNSEAAA